VLFVAMPLRYIPRLGTILPTIAHRPEMFEPSNTDQYLGCGNSKIVSVSLLHLGESSVRKHYLHLSAYPCGACAGPVIAGSTAVRENEISKETDIRQVGAICLSCGRRQEAAIEAARVRHLLPIAWDPVDVTDNRLPTAVFVEALNRAEMH
jgi:hypothetical protein